MPKIEPHIVGGQKLIEIYGRWPSFHDAEVIELQPSRGQLKPGTDNCEIVMPSLKVKIHVMVESPEAHHTLATLKFEEVEEFQMEGFNYQNAILGLSICVEESGTTGSGERQTSSLVVRFQPAFGMSASFRCSSIEVLEAARCTEGGSLPG